MKNHSKCQDIFAQNNNHHNDNHFFLEDNELVRIILVKSGRDAANCWHSLLSNEYSADPWTFNEMEKKLTLERFQKEVISKSCKKVVNNQI